MRYIFFGVLASMGAARVEAGDIWCGGAIIWVMADHSGCGSNLAFKTAAGGSWMCTKSKEGSALILAAHASGKPIDVYIEGGDVSGCATLPWYRQVSYMIVAGP